MALRRFVSILFMIMAIVNKPCVSRIGLVRASRKLYLRKLVLPGWLLRYRTRPQLALHWLQVTCNWHSREMRWSTMFVRPSTSTTCLFTHMLVIGQAQRVWWLE